MAQSPEGTLRLSEGRGDLGATQTWVQMPPERAPISTNRDGGFGRVGLGENAGLGRGEQVAACRSPSCKALGKFLYLSVPRFPHLDDGGDTKSGSLQGSEVPCG